MKLKCPQLTFQKIHGNIVEISFQGVTNFETETKFRSSTKIEIKYYVIKHTINVHVEFEANLLFNKYDVNMMVNGAKKETINHGTNSDFTLRMRAGNNIITFAKTDVTNVYGSVNLTVDGDMNVTYIITAFKDKVTIEQVTSLNATFIPNQSIKMNEIKLVMYFYNRRIDGHEYFLKNSKSGGFSDVIRCDETNYFVWKWHPDKYEQGTLKRETAIRTNSVLRVKTGEVAVFLYKQNNGTMEDYIVGPHDEKLKTKNFPILSSIIGLWYERDTPFQAEVFFINIAESIQIRFGIPYFDVVDPRFPDFQVPVAARGTLTFKIKDYQAFTKYHQLINFSLEDLKNKINAAVSRYVKEAVANAPAEHNIPVIAIESKN